MTAGETASEDRREALRHMRRVLSAHERVVLTTHVNADGDGAGSQVALQRSLLEGGAGVTIVNPTPYPESLEFLLGDAAAFTPRDPEGRAALEQATLVVLMDTSEEDRLGAVSDRFGDARVAVIDHHPDTPTSIGDPAVRDPTAGATGELVYEMLTLDGELLTLEQARALYVAVVTDTGSFRFGNTSPRIHEIAAELLRSGVDVEEMYRRLFARFTPARLALLQRTLSTLEIDRNLAAAWLTLRQSDIDETGASPDDREGIVEYARRLDGIEVAMLFRELQDGRTKVSIRSNGRADVAAVARTLGGGGHPRAAGALVSESIPEAVELLRDRLGREPTV